MKKFLFLALLCSLAAHTAHADVVVTPAPGEAVRLNGPIALPAVPNAAQQAEALCIGANGLLGPCAPGQGNSTPLPTGCTSGQTVRWNGTAWECATPTASNLPACGLGEVLRFGANGVECSPPPHIQSVLDATDGSGQYPAITLGANGLAYVTHHNQDSENLNLHICLNTACTQSFRRPLGSGGNSSAIAVGPDGLPVIAYRNNGQLSVVKCSDTLCAASTARTVSASAGTSIGLAVGVDNLPYISFYEGAADDLRLARCTAADCSATVITTLDAVGDVGGFNAIVLPPDGLPLISYSDMSNDTLKIAKCTNPNCTAPTLRVVDNAPTVGRANRMTLLPGGVPAIVYRQVGEGVRLALCADAACSSASITSIADPQVNDYIGVTTGANGFVTFTHLSNNRLLLTQCTNAACTARTQNVVALNVGWEGAVAVGADGYPLIAYRSGTTLRVVQCSTPSCRQL